VSPIYNKIVSAIKKVLRELVKKYHNIGKFFWDLVEKQNCNTAKLARIQSIINVE